MFMNNVGLQFKSLSDFSIRKYWPHSMNSEASPPLQFSGKVCTELLFLP